MTLRTEAEAMQERLLALYTHREGGLPTLFANPDGREAAELIGRLLAENERLREALTFYADERFYKYNRAAGVCEIEAEGGDLARQALGEQP